MQTPPSAAKAKQKSGPGPGGSSSSQGGVSVSVSVSASVSAQPTVSTVTLAAATAPSLSPMPLPLPLPLPLPSTLVAPSISNSSAQANPADSNFNNTATTNNDLMNPSPTPTSVGNNSGSSEDYSTSSLLGSGSGSGVGGLAGAPRLHLVIDSDGGKMAMTKGIATEKHNKGLRVKLALTTPSALKVHPQAATSTVSQSIQKPLKKSVAFFVLLQNPNNDNNSQNSSAASAAISIPHKHQQHQHQPAIISPTSPSFPSFPRRPPPAITQTTPTTLASQLSLKLARAHYRHLALLQRRRTALRRHQQEINCKILLHAQQERIAVLRIRAHIEYKAVVAGMNRRLALMRVLERCRHRASVAQSRGMREGLIRAVALRRALSESFVSFLEGQSDLSQSGSVATKSEKNNKIIKDRDFGSYGRNNCMIGAASLDDLTIWDQVETNDWTDSDYDAESRSVFEPPTATGESDSQENFSVSEKLSEIIAAMRSEQLIEAATSKSPTTGSSENSEDGTTSTYDRDLLTQFEETFNSSSPHAARSAREMSKIDDLFNLIKSLTESRRNHQSSTTPLSPVSANSSLDCYDDDDTLGPLAETFSSPLKKRSMVSTTRLSEILALNEAMLGAGKTGGSLQPPARRRSSGNVALSPTAKLLRRRDLLDEPLSEIVERNKSLPVKILDQLDESDYMELLPLLPPVTRFTLRELDMDEILLNAQLRHDLYFDPNLQFKPNTEGDRGAAKKAKSAIYWKAIVVEVEGREIYRIPLIIHEIKAILKELLPYSKATHDDIEANIDIGFVAQQLEHGIFDPVPLMKYLSGLLKVNCAPARDINVDGMLKDCEDGKFVESLGACFDVLELMKLDYANHQLQRIRPHVVQNAVEFESNYFKDEIRWKRTTTKQTEIWIKETYRRLFSASSASLANSISATNTQSNSLTTATNLKITTIKPPTLTQTYSNAVLETIEKSPHITPDSETTSQLPEILALDIPRFQAFRNDLQDITILGCLLMLYRQASGPRTTAANMKLVKENLWVLLNDSDTSIGHVVAEMVRAAGLVRGKELSESERKVLDGMVDKTLAPESKVFAMVMSRVVDLVVETCIRAIDGVENTVCPASVACGGRGIRSSSTSSSDDSDLSSPENMIQKPVKSVTGIVKGRSGSFSGETTTPIIASAAALKAINIDRAKLVKYGLTELDEEIQDLANRVGAFAKYNHAVYFDIVTAFYEEARKEEEKLL
ncbi:hypothetical protein HK100_005012 [Physocladia obscura]|uniref:Uncharacterized protein n=1 Tax=Physocladia obscura TaxID=109957 RepID=A0AAD5T7S9_9FUNG|nr:hypothetical protein HK100_005012 [Physocladia obscura]